MIALNIIFVVNSTANFAGLFWVEVGLLLLFFFNEVFKHWQC